MLNTPRSLGGMLVAPHHLAAQAGRDVLKEGGHAVDAMLAAAATIAVVYPHMNGIGGDGFWLIARAGQDPVAVDACGAAALAATPEWYREREVQQIPERGPLASLTVAGSIGGWQQARNVAADWGPALPLSRLLADAIHHARNGVATSRSQAELSISKFDALANVPGFAEQFLDQGRPPAEGWVFRQPALADTLEQLARAGLDDFYRGDLAHAQADDLAAVGSPLRLEDFTRHQSLVLPALSTRLNGVTLFNQPPPTQGMASLMILGMFERLGITEAEGFDHVHGLVEATKQAFIVRDAHCTDPAHMTVDVAEFLTAEAIRQRAGNIDRQRALPWPHPGQPGDTIWMGCIDQYGNAVSFIQSIYWEFGSGVVLPQTGLLWQNRGVSFSLDADGAHPLQPGRKPFHTLNPAMARFDDGRTMVYGTMGGEGQPQSQAALFSRYALFNQPLQQAITAPRWLLGRTWGDTTTTLKLESRFEPALVQALVDAGHNVEVLDAPFSDTMGHAGAIVRHADGVLEGATDPRADGIVAAH